MKSDQESEPPAKEGGMQQKRSAKRSSRILVLVLIGGILIAGSYPVWLRMAERVARAERAHESAKTPSGKRAQAFFDEAATTSEGGGRLLLSKYAEGLEALGEAPLDPKTDANRECYRFTWLRTFHRPVVFRVDVKGDGAASLTIKVADGAGGYEWGKVVRNETKALDKTVAGKLKAQAQKILKSDLYEKTGGFDGSHWLVEVLMNGRYHVVCRWSPTEGDVRNMGQLLIDQAPAEDDFTPVY